MAFTFKTKPTGPHANFTTDCVRCGGELTVTNGRVDRHTCEPQPITLADLRAALDNQAHR